MDGTIFSSCVCAVVVILHFSLIPSIYICIGALRISQLHGNEVIYACIRYSHVIIVIVVIANIWYYIFICMPFLVCWYRNSGMKNVFHGIVYVTTSFFFYSKTLLWIILYYYSSYLYTSIANGHNVKIYTWKFDNNKI